MKVHDRSKVSSVDTVISKNVGSEQSLLEKCVKKYGPEPPPEEFSERLERFFRAKAASRLSEVSKLVSQNKGREQELMATLVQQHGAEPDPPTPRMGPTSPPTTGSDSVDEQRRRLTRYYQHYAPDKTGSDVDTAINKYAATGDFTKMWSILEKKYGPESAVPNVTPATGAPAVSTSSPGSNAVDEQRRRLTRYYQHYAPDKTGSDVDTAINKYAATGN
jgi:hypothetical protein